MRKLSVLMCFAASSLWLGCFEKPSPECAFLCSQADQSCPDGYSCRADGWCKQTSVADNFDCTGGANPADAAVNLDADDSPDASAADASLIDADTTDAPVSTPDADPPDADPPDADPPDADPPDADPIDAFVNASPSVVVPTPKPRLLTVGVADSFMVSGTDPDAGQTVTVSAQFPSGSSAMNPFMDTTAAVFTPAGDTGTFSWTPATAGTFEVQFVATDDHTVPGSAAETLVITVSDPP